MKDIDFAENQMTLGTGREGRTACELSHVSRKQGSRAKPISVFIGYLHTDKRFVDCLVVALIRKRQYAGWSIAASWNSLMSWLRKSRSGGRPPGK